MNGLIFAVLFIALVMVGLGLVCAVFDYADKKSKRFSDFIDRVIARICK